MLVVVVVDWWWRIVQTDNLGGGMDGMAFVLPFLHILSRVSHNHMWSDCLIPGGEQGTSVRASSAKSDHGNVGKIGETSSARCDGSALGASTAAAACWRSKRSHRALLQRQNLLLATLELWATDVVEALQAFTFQTLPLHSSVSTATARHCSVIAQLHLAALF